MAFLQKEQFLNTNESKIIAYIIRKERIEQNLSLRALAAYAKITPQFLSDIEHYKKSPSEYAFQQIQSALDIDFHNNSEYVNEIIDLCNQMFESYIDLDLETISNIYNDLIKQKAKIKYSFALPYYLLASLLYYIAVDHTNDSIYSYISELEVLAFALSKRDLVKFYDLCGYKYTINGDNTSAKHYFDLALELSSINYKSENALLNSHISIHYRMINHLWDALEALNTAIRLFTDLCAFDRIFMNQMKKANLYVLLGFHTKAINKYTYLIQKASKKSQKARLYENLSNCYLENKNYTLALQCCQLSQEYGSTFSTTYFNICFIYWKQQKYKECLAYIHQNCKNENICEIDKMLMISLKHHIQGEKEKVYSALQKILEKPEKDTEYNAIYTILLNLNFAIDIYKSYADYEKAVAIYEEKERIIQSHNL